jgi:hypothetical protein
MGSARAAMRAKERTEEHTEKQEAEDAEQLQLLSSRKGQADSTTLIFAPSRATERPLLQRISKNPSQVSNRPVGTSAH